MFVLALRNFVFRAKKKRTVLQANMTKFANKNNKM